MLHIHMTCTLFVPSSQSYVYVLCSYAYLLITLTLTRFYCLSFRLKLEASSAYFIQPYTLANHSSQTTNIINHQDTKMSEAASRRKALHAKRTEHAATTLSLLFVENFEVLVDDGYGKQDARARTNRTHEVGHDGQTSDAHTTERSRCRNVVVEHMHQGRLAMALHEHLLIFELLCHVARKRARDLDKKKRNAKWCV